MYVVRSETRLEHARSRAEGLYKPVYGIRRVCSWPCSNDRLYSLEILNEDLKVNNLHRERYTLDSLDWRDAAF